MAERRTLGRRIRVAVLGFLARVAYGLLRLTVRPRVIADPYGIRRAFAEGERVIAAFWHGQLAMIHFAYTGRGLAIQVSRHADGEIITRAVSPFGIRAARGSATRGAIGSLREMLRAFDDGLDLAFAADGPRGPRNEAKMGAVQLAKATGARLFPVACAPRRGVVFRRSWDRFTVPLPFTRIYYAAGEPLRVTHEADEEAMEEARLWLEAELRRLTTEVSRAALKGTLRHSLPCR